MSINTDTIDEIVLALLFLNLCDAEGNRAWKSLDWDALNRLHDKGLIGDPVSRRRNGFSGATSNSPMGIRRARRKPDQLQWESVSGSCSVTSMKQLQRSAFSCISEISSSMACSNSGPAANGMMIS